MPILALLRPFLPAISVGLVSALISGGAVWKVVDWKFNTFDKPAIERTAEAEQQAADADAFEQAAARAKREREAEIIRLADKWSTDAAIEAAQDEAQQQVQVNELLQEINDYQAARTDPAARKKWCGLTDDDIRFAG